MKKVLFLFMALLSFRLHAASVQWDCFIANLTTGCENEFWVQALDYALTPCVEIIAVKKETSVSLESRSIHSLSFIGLWCEMACGDVLDYSTMSGRDDYFSATDPYMINGFCPNPIEAEFGSSVYLGVMQSGFGVAHDDPLTKHFGWIELYVDDDGNVTLEHSAMRIDAGPMIVGGGAYSEGIPEPTSGLLFLLGMAHLALRRKKVLII